MSEHFIQDRVATDSKPPEGTQYVLVTVEDNGDVEHLASSDVEDEILDTAHELGFTVTEQTSAGYDLVKEG
jgi:hypothetical protein